MIVAPALPLASSRKAFVNARIVAPAQGLNGEGGILMDDGWILAAGPKVTKETVGVGTQLFDCAGLVIIPGLIDMRVFTGEPGAEYRETLATASEAAVAGGITTMIVMPNTEPVIDDAAIVDFILRRARDTALVRVAPMAAVTKGLAGEFMTEIGALKEAGAVAVTDAVRSVASASLFRRALTYAKDFDMLVVQHVEEPTLSKGVMNASEAASRLGLSGNPGMAEVIMLERDVRLVEMTGARYHAAQISCEESLNVIRAAKARNLPVTCGVSIHHRRRGARRPTVWRWWPACAMARSTSSSRLTIPKVPTPSACRSPRLPSAPSALRRCSRQRSASTTTAMCRSRGWWSAFRPSLLKFSGLKPGGLSRARLQISSCLISARAGPSRKRSFARAPRIRRLKIAVLRDA
jgi:Amidohydrolase family